MLSAIRMLTAGPRDAWRRLRCSRGFGVHSPFAFRFITDVLRERRYGYYAYSSIADPRMKLWFRIACFFQPEAVEASGPRKEQWISVANMAVPPCRTPLSADSSAVNRCRVLRFSESSEGVELQRGEVTVIGNADSEKLTELFDTIDYGMCFTASSGMAVIAALPHLPHQRFDLYF